jgi:hypothetical protein
MRTLACGIGNASRRFRSGLYRAATDGFTERVGVMNMHGIYPGPDGQQCAWSNMNNREAIIMAPSP